MATVAGLLRTLRSRRLKWRNPRASPERQRHRTRDLHVHQRHWRLAAVDDVVLDAGGR